MEAEFWECPLGSQVLAVVSITKYPVDMGGGFGGAGMFLAMSEWGCHSWGSTPDPDVGMPFLGGPDQPGSELPRAGISRLRGFRAAGGVRAAH